MPQNNEIVAALPASGSADKELLRGWAVQRNSFNLRPDEDLRDFVMIDPDGGGTTPSVVQNGMLYGHDSDDVTTGHDGVYCLVSYDSQRYKLEAGLHAPFNVLDKDLTAPPTSPAPSHGDAYLIYGSPTGSWAGKSGYIAIFTARGWSFCLPPLGFLVYVRDENAYYHRDDLGAWTLGTGTRTLGNNSVTAANIIGQIVRWRVINQTTTAPPASPSVGDQYIIGPSATGDWAGLDGKIAICEVVDTFTIYSPSNGWEAYDKSLNGDYRFNGSGWVPAGGVVVAQGSASDTSTYQPSKAGVPGTSNQYSPTTAPSTGIHIDTDTFVTIAAPSSSAVIEFNVSIELLGMSLTREITIGIRRDSESALVSWWPIYSTSSDQFALRKFRVAASDTLEHTYRVAIYRSDNGDTLNAFRAREISYKVLV